MKKGAKKNECVLDCHHFRRCLYLPVLEKSFLRNFQISIDKPLKM